MDVGRGISLEFERHGDPARPTVLLIMGLGMQLVAWPRSLIDGLLARGFSVLRFDNRDSGLSTQIDSFHPRGIAGALLRGAVGWPVAAPYTLDDLAQDTVGLLDALEIERAHIVGASMGGMVAQIVAARWPQRTLSLTSIMSTSGHRRLPPPRLNALMTFMRRPPHGAPLAAVFDHYMHLFSVIGSPGYPTPPAQMRERMQQMLSRAFRPRGTARQLLAVAASGDRTALLPKITAPTLVVHGEADPLVPVAAGRDTARRIPGAQLLTVPGMGHDLPEALMPMLAAAMADHFDSQVRVVQPPTYCRKT